MADDPKITAETVKQMAAELLALPLDESEQEMVAGLLNSLHKDMRALQRMDTTTAEPATLYRPGDEPGEGDA
ncbi:hypothetical protein Pan258_47770 [Symmachiella dynata]|uniref:hypothetical protein n=1 Tax=Symmachiella dynata TaxID=2527995 RepID=UPI00118AF49A|nr:hypothetical protein [Symmachiella dynata]QDT50697.1 hypothetical protein Pan258_47770 [Symmachiella dynata]